MRIQGPGRPGPVDPTRKATGTAESVSEKRDAGERVRVSPEAKLLTEARLPEAPDTALVDRLRDAISKGAFKVDAERIADLMLKEEKG